MRNRNYLLLILACFLAGCTEDVNSVTREYRNTTNEAIDALMLTTSEASAEVAVIRVFKQLGDRFNDLDTKLKILMTNRTKQEYVKEVYESNGAHLYLSELEVNRARYNLELARLKILIKQCAERERELRASRGGNMEQADESKLCPHLSTLLSLAEGMRSQLEKPEFPEKMKEFPQWSQEGKVKDFEKLFSAYKQKQESFKQREFKLGK